MSGTTDKRREPTEEPQKKPWLVQYHVMVSINITQLPSLLFLCQFSVVYWLTCYFSIYPLCFGLVVIFFLTSQNPYEVAQNKSKYLPAIDAGSRFEHQEVTKPNTGRFDTM